MSHPANPRKEEQPRFTCILVVEDDADVAEVIAQAILEETPYMPLLATDGVAALKMVRSIKPDLLLLDYLLPGMDGIELYDRLHAEQELQDISAVFISANAPKAELEKRRVYYITDLSEFTEFLQKLRVNAPTGEREKQRVYCIKKPFELDDLLQALKELLG